MIVGSRTPVIYDEWEDEGIRCRLASRGQGPMEMETFWTTGGWQVLNREDAAPVLMRRLQARITVNNVEARRISFLAAALMRCIQLADKLVEEERQGSNAISHAKRHLAALKGVALACGMPLGKWEVQIEGVEEDPETAEARRRLGLDVKASS